MTAFGSPTGPRFMSPISKLTFINCPTFVGGDAATSLYPRPVGLTDHSTQNLQRVVTIWAAVSARSSPTEVIGMVDVHQVARLGARSFTVPYHSCWPIRRCLAASRASSTKPWIDIIAGEVQTSRGRTL